jgi:hypothetical protein
LGADIDDSPHKVPVAQVLHVAATLGRTGTATEMGHAWKHLAQAAIMMLK